MYGTIEERFWAKVEKSEGCWLWTAYRNKDGYGIFRLKSKSSMVNAHRISWQITHGTIPHGLEVLHTCDNPGCVRPDHLFLGTQTDNIYDMEAKGRGIHPRGKDLNISKLDEEKVVAIRVAYKSGGCTYRSLASLFNVHPTNIRAVIKGWTWKYVQEVAA